MTMPTPAVAPMARQGQGRVRRREGGRADPRSAVAADEDGLRSPRRRGPVGDVDEGRPPVHLDHAGMRHRARDRDEGSAGVLHEAVGAEGIGPRPGDHRDVGQRLGVVDQRAAAADAEGGALVGSEGRQGATRVDPADERRLLPGDEAVGRPHEHLGDRRASRRGPFGHGRRDGGGDLLAAFGHADRDPTGAARRGEELGAVEHQVRRAQQEQLVLVAVRLALHRVDEDRAAPAGGVRHGQLDRRREPGPAAPRQARGLQHRHERLTPSPGARRWQRDRPERRHVPGQVGRMAEEAVPARGREDVAGARHVAPPLGPGHSTPDASEGRRRRRRGPS